MTQTPTWSDALTDSTPVPRTAYAPWSSRVVATLVDGAVITGLAFLVAGPVPLPDVIPHVSLYSPDAASSDGFVTPWSVVAIALVFLLLQAYGGATPGKRVVGIAVVSDRDGRPVGLLRTVARWFAQFLDAILFIGFLRPLWHPQRKTFADSIIGTVVIRTRLTVINPVVAELTRTPQDGLVPPVRGSLGEPAGPLWQTRTTTVAVVVCVVAGLFGLPSWQSSMGAGRSVCALQSDVQALAAGFELVDAAVVLVPWQHSEQRLWATRTATRSSADAHAEWTWNGATTTPLTLVVEVRDQDGSILAQATQQVPAGVYAGEQLLGTAVDGAGWVGIDPVDIPRTAAESTWTVQTRAVSGGIVIGACSA